MFRPDHSIELLPVKTRVFPRRSMGQRNTRSNSDSNNKAEAALLNGTEGPLRFKQSPTRSVPHFEQSEEPNKKNRNNNSRTSRSSNNNNGGGNKSAENGGNKKNRNNNSRTSRSSNNNNGGGNKSAENGGDVNRTMSLPLIAKGGSNGRLIGDGAWPASFSYSAMKDGESRRQKKPRELKQKKTQKPDSGKNSSSNNITTNNNDSNLSIRNTGELNEKPQLSLARSGAQLNSEIIASRRNSASVSMEERLPSAVSYSGSLNNFGSRPRSRSGSLRGLSLSRCSSRSSRSDGGGSDGMRMPLTEKQQVALRELPMAVTRCHTPPPPQLLRASSSFLVKKRSRR
ncbi:hypothetical protein DQ04_10841000, partial [Trypanosoma grayi]|uniref:hypothetical protein n=1 Tax=Trypanosoma grayi TaxID=71804 RepID=UPI0004F48D16